MNISDEFEKGFELACELFKAQEDRERMRQLQAKSPIELIAQEDYLREIDARINDINARLGCFNKKTPTDLVASLRATGRKDHEIALVLSAEGVSTYQIGLLLPARLGATIALESVSKRGRNLLKKGKEARLNKIPQ